MSRFLRDTDLAGLNRANPRLILLRQMPHGEIQVTTHFLARIENIVRIKNSLGLR
ncbi:MAG: hypothetical protein UY02_C0054G0001, partial [Candidatus Giovannonibacteria bacterium GW2011_GWB1_47_6b]